ncbi:MAG: hypothetical protein IT460_01155 [Planctomycetes bacterium]|nr:hypothetical protein [Planctomycetota bacterium]
MAKLQPCPKCGAQFDVSAMAPGAAFTCGACGAIVTAGAPASPSRVPPTPPRAAAAAPSRPVPPPSPARTPPAPVAKSQRGPQYVPVERHREAAAAAPAAAPSARASRREEAEAPAGRRARGGREDARRAGGPPKKGLSPVAMAGIGGGVLLVAVVALMMANKKDPAKDGGPAAKGGSTSVAGTPGTSGTAGATAPGTGTPSGAPKAGATGTAPASGIGGETLADVNAEYGKKSFHTNDDLKRFFERFKALGSAGEARAKELAAKIVAEADPNYEPARLVLGHKKFDHEVPELISFRKYPYLQAVEAATAQRWFDDDEAYDLAMKAWAKTEAHAKRLDPDHGDSTFRALDGARLTISNDKNFKDYNYEAIFASPYLICYSSDDRMTEEELFQLPKKERIAKLAELEKKREGYRRILAEKARIYQQLYKNFLERYGETCELHDLMGEYGGRPDLPPGKRSYKDGCPLIVWIFSDRKAFDDYHQNVVKDPIHPGVAGYFSPGTGWVYLYDEPDNREFEINKNVHEGTHQLEHWFQMQKREWGRPFVPQSFFGEGFAEYIGAVSMAPDRTLTFHGVNRPRLEFLQNTLKQLQSGGKKMLIFPTQVLVGFEGYGSVDAWAAENWGTQGLGIFYAQSWAFVYFLNEANGKKYREKFNGFLDDMLNHPREDWQGYAFKHFKDRFGIKSDSDWKKLHAEFESWYLGTMMKMDAAKVSPPPPSREDWPGYTPIDPVDPTRDAPKSN